MEGFKWELAKALGYHLYCFRMAYVLSESEMIEIMRLLVNAPQFKKEYGEEL